MIPDPIERRSRDAPPQPPWRGGHPATACKAALLLLALALPALGQDPATNAATHAAEGPPPAQGPLPLKPGYDIHVVAPGETLFGLARRHGVPMQTIVDANGLADPDRTPARIVESGVRDIDDSMFEEASCTIDLNRLPWRPFAAQP